MIIKFRGQTELNKFMGHTDDIIKDMLVKAGLPGDTPFQVRDVEVGVVFKLDNEYHYMTVTHDDINEILEVYVKLDESGDIDKNVNNVESSFMDDYSKAVAKGEEYTNEPIMSQYDDALLVEVERLDLGDELQVVKYDHKDDDALEVIRYYRGNNVLVGEIGYNKESKEN